jgi:hypothetical protein
MFYRLLLRLVRITGGGAVSAKDCISRGILLQEPVPPGEDTSTRGAETMSCTVLLELVRITGGGAISAKDCFSRGILLQEPVPPGEDTTTRGAETIPYKSRLSFLYSAV